MKLPSLFKPLAPQQVVESATPPAPKRQTRVSDLQPVDDQLASLRRALPPLKRQNAQSRLSIDHTPRTPTPKTINSEMMQALRQAGPRPAAAPPSSSHAEVVAAARESRANRNAASNMKSGLRPIREE